MALRTKPKRSTKRTNTKVSESMVNYEILLPNDEIVLRFEQQSKDIFKKINQNKKQIQTLENLRDTLLPNLLSGEVRVEI